MNTQPVDKSETDEEERRLNEALKRALNTPPKPRKRESGKDQESSTSDK